MKNISPFVLHIFGGLILCAAVGLSGCDPMKGTDGTENLIPTHGMSEGGKKEAADVGKKVEKAIKDAQQLIDESQEKMADHHENIRSILNEGKRHMGAPPTPPVKKTAPYPEGSPVSEIDPDDIQTNDMSDSGAETSAPEKVSAASRPPTVMLASSGTTNVPAPAQNIDDETLLKAALADGADDEEGTPDMVIPEEGEAEEDERWEEMLSEKFNRPLELGEVFFEHPETLVRMDEAMPVWVDREKKNVVMQGWVCQTRAPLEFFMCTGRGILRLDPYDGEEGMPEQIIQFYGAKTHEAVVCVDVRPSIIHACLLAIGAKPGEPVRFHPEFKPATGEEIEILVRWKDEDGKTVEKRGQDVIKNAVNDEKMNIPWVFAGSFFYYDEEENTPPEKRTQYYAADSEGEIVGVSNFPSAMLDVPQASTASDSELLFVADQDVLPQRGTPVTVIMQIKKKEPDTVDASAG